MFFLGLNSMDGYGSYNKVGKNLRLYKDSKLDEIKADPEIKERRNALLASAIYAGYKTKILSNPSSLGSLKFRQNLMGAYLLGSIIRDSNNGIGRSAPISMIATGATALLGYKMYNYMGSGTLLASKVVLDKLSNRAPEFAEKLASNVLKAQNLNPIFKSLLSQEGLKLAAFIGTIPVAHSIIRKVVSKISDSQHKAESPYHHSSHHSITGHHGKKHEDLGTTLKNSAKQQAAVNIFGSLTTSYKL